MLILNWFSQDNDKRFKPHIGSLIVMVLIKLANWAQSRCRKQLINTFPYKEVFNA